MIDLTDNRMRVIPVESARTAAQCSSPALGGLIVKIRYKCGEEVNTGFVVDFSAINLFICEEYNGATAYEPRDAETLLRWLAANGDRIKVTRARER